LPPDKQIKQFSKGMKMKLAISVALSHHFKLLILDEATSGLDPVIRDDILDVTSTLEMLGKPIRSDDRNEKTTYVTIRGLEQASKDVEEISGRALSRLASLSCENEFLTELIKSLIYREK